MAYVDLKRRFSKWCAEKASDENFNLFEGSFTGEASWDDLLNNQRVILLAAVRSLGNSKSEQISLMLMASLHFTRLSRM